MKKYDCPVCGYDELYEPPRSAEGGGSYEICPSCGFQFGVSDEDKGISYEEWRKRWIEGGMAWWSRRGRTRPADWNPSKQLERVTGGRQQSR